MPVFVFGSNQAGRHGKGAALHAAQHFGAAEGVGEGRTGLAYALPTKDAHLKPLPPEALRAAVRRFLDYAHEHPADLFLLTPVGCGLAGNPVEHVVTMLRQRGPLPLNVLLHPTWMDHFKPAVGGWKDDWGRSSEMGGRD